MDMDNELDPIALDPELFARVWKRVAPDEAACPVELDVKLPPPNPGRDTFPLGDEASGSSHFLQERILLELRRWRSYQYLACFPGQHSLLSSLASQTHARARRLTAALFLITGGWYFPAGQAKARRWPNLRAGLRSLFRSSQRDEADYRQAAEATADPLLRALFLELANENQIQQNQLRRLLEQSL